MPGAGLPALPAQGGLFEKRTLFLKGGKCSGVVTEALTDLYMLKKPNAVKLVKNNHFYPFSGGQENIEFLCRKNESGLFVFGNHSKKRPNNMIFGRTYNYQLLDMLELGLDKFIPGVGDLVLNKPMICFVGNEWKANVEMSRIQNYFFDYFRGADVDQINLAGLNRLIVLSCKTPSEPPTDGLAEGKITATGYRVFIRQYSVEMKKQTGSKFPQPELTEVGPHLNFVVRRIKFAPQALLRQACKISQQEYKETHLPKNVSRDNLGNVVATTHMVTKAHEFGKMKKRAYKYIKNERALNKKRTRGEAEEGEGGDQEQRKKKFKAAKRMSMVKKPRKR